jgi:hypothetical protein
MNDGTQDELRQALQEFWDRQKDSHGRQQPIP